VEPLAGATANLSVASGTNATASYEADRDYVLAILRRRCGWLDSSDREALLHDAYAVLLEKQRDGVLDLDAMHPQQVRAYLTQTALNKALDEGKRAGRRRSVPIGEADALADDRGNAAVEHVDAGTDRARIQEILAELPARQQRIVRLRFFLDRSPTEIQRYLGVTNRVYRRELERAMRSISERFQLVLDGTFCDSRRSVVLAFVAGIAGPGRASEARRHLETCPGCARWAAELRAASERVAAAVSLPAIPLTVERPHDGIAKMLDLVATAKRHAANLVLRADAATSQYAASLRPGAATAAIAGCLALGGATYCAVDGVPQPWRALDGGKREAQKSHEPRSAEPRVKKHTAPPVTVRTTPPVASAPTAPKRSKPHSSASKPKPAEAGNRVNQEFGPEGLGGASAGATTATPSQGTGSGPATPAERAPQPEFDP
jgi:RNA polymerase sigma factor (sigma-70 family)